MLSMSGDKGAEWRYTVADEDVRFTENGQIYLIPPRIQMMKRYLDEKANENTSYKQ